MRKETIKEKNNILFELHESLFVDYKLDKDNLILRFAINCAIVESLGVKSKFGEKYYIYDVVCHNLNFFEVNNVYDIQLLLCEILDFMVYDNKFSLILIEGINEIYFTFDCESIEWIPIVVLSSDELDRIEETKYYKIF
ncbi:MAG: hypothetical protein ACI35W_04070 [Anaeroplasmataceae bacterium]